MSGIEQPTAVLLATALLAVPAAGCFGSDGSLEAANATESADEATNATDLGTLPDGNPVPTQATLTGCSEQGGVFPVPQAMVGDVPEGFSFVSMDPAGLTATLLVIGLSCSLNDEEPVSELYGLVAVEPPEELAGETGTHAILLGGFSSLERQATIYRAWGMGEDVMPGDVTVEILQDTPVARGGHVLGTDGDFTVHMYSSVEGEPNPESAGEARVFGVADAEVTGAMDLTWTDSEGGYQTGEASLAFEGGDVPIPQPAGAGVAFHFWGEDYDITFEHVDLDETE